MNSRDRRLKRRRKRAAKAAASRVPPVEHTGPLELFRSGREARVRFAQVLAFLLAPVALWGAHDAAFNPADILSRRGEVVSWAVRYGTAALLFVVALGGAIGMVVYGWCYVTHAVWDPEAGECHLTLAGFFVPVHVTVPPAGEPRYLRRDGFSRGGGVVVNAPYYSFRIPGRRLPFIVDLQGEFRYGDLFHRVFLGASEFETLTSRDPVATRRAR